MPFAHQGDASAILEFQTECELLELLERRSNVIRRFTHDHHPMDITAGTRTVPLKVPYLVLEAADGDLEELLLARHSVDWEDRLRLFRDVTKGVHQLQLDRVVSRDLKSENVLLVDGDTGVVAKIADMGRGRSLRHPVRFPAPAYEHGRGDRRFIAPELLWGLGTSDEDHMRLGDLYLLGSIFFELATGQGITAMAIGSPETIISASARLTPAKREASFRAYASDLQARYELTYELFGRELPGPARQVGVDLLRTLTSVQPEEREPLAARRRHGDERWDLQWILRRIDIMIHNVRIDRRTRERPGI